MYKCSVRSTSNIALRQDRAWQAGFDGTWLRLLRGANSTIFPSDSLLQCSKATGQDNNTHEQGHK